MTTNGTWGKQMQRVRANQVLPWDGSPSSGYPSPLRNAFSDSASEDEEPAYNRRRQQMHPTQQALPNNYHAPPAPQPFPYQHLQQNSPSFGLHPGLPHQLPPEQLYYHQLMGSPHPGPVGPVQHTPQQAWLPSHGRQAWPTHTAVHIPAPLSTSPRTRLAATAIQKVVRGYLTRKWFHERQVRQAVRDIIEEVTWGKFEIQKQEEQCRNKILALERQGALDAAERQRTEKFAALFAREADIRTKLDDAQSEQRTRLVERFLDRLLILSSEEARRLDSFAAARHEHTQSVHQSVPVTEKELTLMGHMVTALCNSLQRLLQPADAVTKREGATITAAPMPLFEGLKTAIEYVDSLTQQVGKMTDALRSIGNLAHATAAPHLSEVFVEAVGTGDVFTQSLANIELRLQEESTWLDSLQDIIPREYKLGSVQRFCHDLANRWQDRRQHITTLRVENVERLKRHRDDTQPAPSGRRASLRFKEAGSSLRYPNSALAALDTLDHAFRQSALSPSPEPSLWGMQPTNLISPTSHTLPATPSPVPLPGGISSTAPSPTTVSAKSAKPGRSRSSPRLVADSGSTPVVPPLSGGSSPSWTRGGGDSDRSRRFLDNRLSRSGEGTLATGYSSGGETHSVPRTIAFSAAERAASDAESEVPIHRPRRAKEHSKVAEKILETRKHMERLQIAETHPAEAAAARATVA
eukprot:TRINITY_DN3600_c0_g1_i2.p1 TRINITY_DN3600_c0_g1~~TRINITY_DN3600_c0_g1_i2.p1  ORF type:complete len:694 (-),score=90.20 TRINITY_DN3600_c0_g1_i2:298-2379(-)